MIAYLVNGQKVDANGKPVESPPFADLSETAQKSLEAAGIKTVEQAQALGKDGLVELDGIGAKTADSILAL